MKNCHTTSSGIDCRFCFKLSAAAKTSVAVAWPQQRGRVAAVSAPGHGEWTSMDKHGQAWTSMDQRAPACARPPATHRFKRWKTSPFAAYSVMMYSIWSTIATELNSRAQT